MVVLCGLAILGLLLRNMRVSSFYVAGRSMPVSYAALAFAAIAMALLAPFAQTLPAGLSLPALIGGFAGGCIVAANVTGPLLRKTGALSIIDMIIARFPSTGLRLGVVVVVAIAGALVGLAGLSAATRLITLATGFSPLASLALAGLVIAAIVQPGGLSGLVWAAAAAAGIVLVGLALPLALAALADGNLPLPVVGDHAAWTEAMDYLVRWQAVPSVQRSVDPIILTTLIIGLAALAPVLMPAMATQARVSAQRAGLAGIAWCVVLLVLAFVSLAVATLALVHGVDGLRPDRLPGFLLEASGRGDVTICGGHPATPAAAREICAGVVGAGQNLQGGHIAAVGSYLVHGVATLRGFGSSYAGLTTAGGIALALVLAAAGLQAVGSALGHDLLYRARASSALTSRRLAATRLVMLVALVAGGIFLRHQVVSETGLIGFAVALSAAVVMPLMLLSLWARATSLHATLALVVGLGAAEVVISLSGSGPTAPTFARAALCACGVALATGVIASLLQRADPTSHGAAFVHGVLYGESDVINPDKAA
jgi:cation/acetate symporter